jgi:hypothetical protein
MAQWPGRGERNFLLVVRHRAGCSRTSPVSGLKNFSLRLWICFGFRASDFVFFLSSNNHQPLRQVTASST